MVDWTNSGWCRTLRSFPMGSSSLQTTSMKGSALSSLLWILNIWQQTITTNDPEHPEASDWASTVARGGSPAQETSLALLVMRGLFFNAIVILIPVFQVCIGTDNRFSPQGGRCLLTGMGNRLLQVKHLFRIELFSIRRYDNCYPRIDGTTNIGGTYIDFQAICKTLPILISKYSIFILCCAGISYECSQW